MSTIRTGPFAGLRRHYYSTVYIDPPWRFLTYDKVKVVGRGMVKHYPAMTDEEIAALPIGDLVADDCAMFLWVHNSMFEHAIAVLKAWDFKLTNPAFVWVKVTKDGKPRMAGGLTATRMCSEQCWLATRGHPKRLSADVRQVIIEQVRESGRKPDRVRGDIERLFAGPYLELFARARTVGWDSWGREVDKFPLVTEPDKYPDGFPAIPSTLKWQEVA
jgi:N6-adenosine-specific RNA methylase IME4